MIIEDGVIAGNVYDKYGSRNPIVRYLMKGFHDSLASFVALTGAMNIHEVGCGEGKLSIEWAKQGKTVKGSDFSKQVIAVAIENAKKQHVNIEFKDVSIYDLISEKDVAELIICCEVLEHLDRPHAALEVLSRLAQPYLIVSVPREPLWSILNLARGKYISSLGNTPGHIQRWSKTEFLELVSSRFEILKVATPIPWTMALCRVKPD